MNSLWYRFVRLLCRGTPVLSSSISFMVNRFHFLGIMHTTNCGCVDGGVHDVHFYVQDLDDSGKYLYQPFLQTFYVWTIRRNFCCLSSRRATLAMYAHYMDEWFQRLTQNLTLIKNFVANGRTHILLMAGKCIFEETHWPTCTTKCFLDSPLKFLRKIDFSTCKRFVSYCKSRTGNVSRI